MPAEWTTFKLRYRYRETFYDITVAQTLDRGTGQRVNVDGIDARDALVRLVDDRRDHRVAVTIPRSRDVNRGEA